MRRISVTETFLIQAIIYLFLWLWNDYLATILSLSFAGIFFSIWLLSLIVEWIEPSKVPKWYFQYVFVSALAPIVIGAFFLLVYGMPDWMLGG